MSVLSPAAQADGGAPAIRTDTPSGQPVPRFVSLKHAKTNCRIGPSTEHPVRYVFRREGAPVMVVAESVDYWRKIRDFSGDECWAHRVTLRPQSHVQTTQETALRRKPGEGAPTIATLGPGVLARIEGRHGGWLKVSAERLQGWVKAADVWGGDALSAASRN
ncbi:MAG: SH3 domain-containing protein [Parvularculaceae bacterium]|nr:SH3 domain-containing protein [Parvularculaceae bacterium]